MFGNQMYQHFLYTSGVSFGPPHRMQRNPWFEANCLRIAQGVEPQQSCNVEKTYPELIRFAMLFATGELPLRRTERE